MEEIQEKIKYVIRINQLFVKDNDVIGISFTFLVIERGGKLALRLFDREAETLRNFEGIDRFEARLRWRKFGRFEPYLKPRKITITTAIQTTEEAQVKPPPKTTIWTSDPGPQRPSRIASSRAIGTEPAEVFP